MNWTEVYKHIDAILAEGCIIGACISYYLSVKIEFYSRRDGCIFICTLSPNGKAVYSHQMI